MNHPRVGVGVYIRKDNKILFMKRLSSSHGHETWSPPGGHLEFGESFKDCAKREVMEEVGLEISNIQVAGITNDVYEEEKHYVTIHVVADYVSGDATILEPEKCVELQWCQWNQLPTPLMLSNQHFLELSINPFKL